jgi:hypothetical protein
MDELLQFAEALALTRPVLISPATPVDEEAAELAVASDVADTLHEI